jgi:hypothetical protein
MSERPDQFEAPRSLDTTSQSMQLEAAGTRDDNATQLDSSLHGNASSSLETHLRSMSDVNSVPTQDTMQAAREYATYKNGLIRDVFDENGNLRPDAPTKSMQALYDLNNAEVAATQKRIASIDKSGNQLLAVAAYEDQGNTLPRSMRDTQVRA